MNSTPLWVPLLVAALGLLGAIAGTLIGVIVTQRMANKREHESWERETARERERWQREDEALTFEHRRVAYVEFFEALRKMQVRVEWHAMKLAGEEHAELEDDWQTDAWEKLQHLELYATPRVGSLATEAFRATSEWGRNTSYGGFGSVAYSQRESFADDTKAALLLAIRADLRIPDYDDLPLPDESPGETAQ